MFKRTQTLFIVALCAFFVLTARAELVFEQTKIELHPAVGDATAVAHFKYQNKGDKAIAIKGVHTSCGCTAASAKQTADPNEKGEVTATFTVGDRVGTQQKAITVETDDPKSPTMMLNLTVVIPQVLELVPAFVTWQNGEPNKPKTIVAKIGKDAPVKNVEATSSSPDITTKVEKSSDKEFKIQIEPKGTDRLVAATLTIKSELKDGKTKAYYAMARVMPPAGAPTAVKPPINPATSPLAASLASPAGSPAASSSTAALPLAANGKLDACGLLTSKDIESVQGHPLKEAKASRPPTPEFAISQCYFELPTASDSISLNLMQKGDSPTARDPKEFWKETFHRDDDKDKDKEKEKGKERGEERENSVPPKKIDGVGDEAFWIGNRVGGTLYVLKGNAFIRISVGGAGDEASKIDKSKKLAQIAVKKL